MFKIIDKKTGKEPSTRVIQNIAEKGGLIVTDIDQFFIGEDGSIILMDECGNSCYCSQKRFKVEVDE